MVLTETVIQPDAYLWYTLCGILGGSLLSVLVWIGIRTEKLLQELVKSVANHETRITVLETNGNGNGKHKK